MKHAKGRYSPPLMFFGISSSPEGEIADAIDRADLPVEVSHSTSQKTRLRDGISVPYQDQKTRNIDTSQ